MKFYIVWYKDSNRVTTCVENLEISEIFSVRDFTKNQG